MQSQNNGNTVTIKGTIAQLVEQRTENPCVAGSIPAGTTENPLYVLYEGFVRLKQFIHHFWYYSASINECQNLIQGLRLLLFTCDCRLMITKLAAVIAKLRMICAINAHKLSGIG